jgi:hypothetical protein
MRKRNHILLAMSIVLMLLGIRYVMFLNARHHLLCEELKFGMSADEVLGVLHQNGEFTVNKAEWLGGLIELNINFIDPKGAALYGAFELGFFHYKYNRASTGGNIDLGPRGERICYLGQVTQ